jgi:alanine-glyoxylate transaminase / (R)-3-amino-2-methylpropionate-pyruvate transaminase
VTTTEIAEVLTRRNYLNTFGGNPVCTAAGLAVLRVLEKEKLQENAFAVGSYLKDGLKLLQDKHDSKLRQIAFACFQELLVFR